MNFGLNSISNIICWLNLTIKEIRDQQDKVCTKTKHVKGKWSYTDSERKSSYSNHCGHISEQLWRQLDLQKNLLDNFYDKLSERFLAYR